MTPAPPSADAPDDAPLMDRRADSDRRSRGERRAGRESVDKDRRSAADRRQTVRRQASRPARNINQYDMSPDVLEFVNAVNRFRETSGNRFPSAGDILQILKDLGYEKRA